MGYSLTAVSVARVKSFLDEMLSSNSDITWAVSDFKFAYYLREGLAAAKHLKIERYDKLDIKYKIRTRPGKVIAELRDSNVGGIRAQEIVTTIEGATTLYQIAGAIVEHKGASAFSFPNAAISEEDYEKLQKLAEKQQYKITRQPLMLSKK